jgi:hypothetical protein
MSLINIPKNAIEFGNKIINENDFIKDLTSLMENEEFINFFNKYMNDWTSVKSSIMYIKLYDEFKEKYKEINDIALDKNIVVYLLCKVMRNKDLRNLSIETIDKIYNEDKVDYFDELEKFMNKQLLLS